MSRPHPAIELRGVTRTHPGPPTVTALREVTVTIWPGELVAVVGPSGSGKSTLLNVLGTLDRPTRGQVLVDGIDASGLPDRQLSALRARRIGFVFQQFLLLPALDAVDNVATGLTYRDVPRRERRRRATETLEHVGLGHRLTHRPSQLSGGEQQRVAIARALVGDPTVILADEPTGNLDHATGQEIVGLLRGLHDHGVTVVLVTHDHTLAAALPRRITLRDGAVVPDGQG